MNFVRIFSLGYKLMNYLSIKNVISRKKKANEQTHFAFPHNRKI